MSAPKEPTHVSTLVAPYQRLVYAIHHLGLDDCIGGLLGHCNHHHNTPAMTKHSPGMATLYAFWALAVCSRALWQYMVDQQYLLPTHLSALAGILYLAIAYWAWHGQVRALRIGLVIECCGVIAVSIYEQFMPLAYATAWSQWGAGYLYIPLALPVVGLIMTRNSQR